jgi:hypothetical protein
VPELVIEPSRSVSRVTSTFFASNAPPQDMKGPFFPPGQVKKIVGN